MVGFWCSEIIWLGKGKSTKAQGRSPSLPVDQLIELALSDLNDDAMIEPTLDEYRYYRCHLSKNGSMRSCMIY